MRRRTIEVVLAPSWTARAYAWPTDSGVPEQVRLRGDEPDFVPDVRVATASFGAKGPAAQEVS